MEESCPYTPQELICACVGADEQVWTRLDKDNFYPLVVALKSLEFKTGRNQYHQQKKIVKIIQDLLEIEDKLAWGIFYLLSKPGYLTFWASKLG